MIVEWNNNGVPASIEFDATTEEQHDKSNTVTTRPTETGQPVSDHVRNNPDKVSFTCVVSNHPTRQPGTHANGATFTKGTVNLSIPSTTKITSGADGSSDAQRSQTAAQKQDATADVYQFSTLIDRVNAVWAELSQLSLNRIPVSCVSGYTAGVPVPGLKFQYDNMIIESISLPRNSESGDSITFTIGLVNVRTVATQEVAPAAPSKQKANKGAKSTKQLQDPADTPTLTLARKLQAGLQGLLGQKVEQ